MFFYLRLWKRRSHDLKKNKRIIRIMSKLKITKQYYVIWKMNFETTCKKHICLQFKAKDSWHKGLLNNNYNRFRLAQLFHLYHNILWFILLHFLLYYNVMQTKSRVYSIFWSHKVMCHCLGSYVRQSAIYIVKLLCKAIQKSKTRNPNKTWIFSKIEKLEI